MTQRTVQPPPAEDREPYPLDVETMRHAARRLLAANAAPLSRTELHRLAVQLRSHIALAAPEVETLALALPLDDVPRACALACVGEAQQRFSQLADGTLAERTELARKLAHVVNALCDHYESLNGGESHGVAS